MRNIMRKILLLSLLLVLPACNSVALLMSGGSIAVNNNVYMKAFNATNMVTIVTTKKDIKTHAYNYIVKPTFTYVVNPTKEYVLKPVVVAAKKSNTIQMAFGWEQEYINYRKIGKILPKNKPEKDKKEMF